MWIKNFFSLILGACVQQTSEELNRPLLLNEVHFRFFQDSDSWSLRARRLTSDLFFQKAQAYNLSIQQENKEFLLETDKADWIKPFLLGSSFQFQLSDWWIEGASFSLNHELKTLQMKDLVLKSDRLKIQTASSLYKLPENEIVFEDELEGVYEF
jgi:hypothetical protein